MIINWAHKNHKLSEITKEERERRVCGAKYMLENFVDQHTRGQFLNKFESYAAARMLTLQGGREREMLNAFLDRCEVAGEVRC